MLPTFGPIYGANHLMPLARGPIARGLEELELTGKIIVSSIAEGFLLDMTLAIKISPSVRARAEQVVNTGSNLKLNIFTYPKKVFIYSSRS